MSQRCPTCRLYNPDTALRCDCGYDFEAKEQRSSYVVAETARRHGGFQPLLLAQARQNVRNGYGLLGAGLTIGLVMWVLSSPTGEQPPRGGLVPGGLIASGLWLAMRGHNQKRAAASLTRPDDSSQSDWVDRT